MGVDRPSGRDNIEQFPRTPLLLQEISTLITATRSLIEERYSSLYFGSVGRARVASDEINTDKEAEKAALLAVKDACDALESSMKELEAAKLDNAKIKTAERAKTNLESALMEFEMFF